MCLTVTKEQGTLSVPLSPHTLPLPFLLPRQVKGEHWTEKMGRMLSEDLEELHFTLFRRLKSLTSVYYYPSFTPSACTPVEKIKERGERVLADAA